MDKSRWSLSKIISRAKSPRPRAPRKEQRGDPRDEQPEPSVVSSSLPANTPDEPPTLHVPPIESNTAIISTPEELWDRAYDNLKRNEPRLLELYEKTLSGFLDGSEGEAGRNIIEQDPSKRLHQMYGLLRAGLDKTAKLATTEKKISGAIDIILSVKTAISGALQAIPIAALAWTGICFTIQILQNPLNETTANRDGITQVVHKMKWYSILPKLLLKETLKNDQHLELRGQLADLIYDLYEVILKYVIKSVCKYHRPAVLGYLRDIVKLDDWNASIEDIKETESTLETFMKHYRVEQANSYLGILASLQLSQAQNGIMQKLCVTDMDAEIESLQNRKDRLLADSYKWIFVNDDYKEFTNWNSNNPKRILWIKGDAGKGKTMLLMGIIRELDTQRETHFDDNSHLSYFFCQGTNNKLNTATSILRGLIWMLLRQQKSLIHYLDEYKDLGDKLFESQTSFSNLKKVLCNMLKDKSLERAYVIVDALDECRREEPGLLQLLELISDISTNNDNVKWLLTSRNEIDIERSLKEDEVRKRLSLELNAASVASAVKVYIDYKMSELAETYREIYINNKKPEVQQKFEQLLEQVANEIHQKANGTFLWVALVFRRIKEIGCSVDRILNLIRGTPSGLNELYEQMMKRAMSSNDSELCEQVLLAMANAYRPLHLSELEGLAALTEWVIPQDIVKLCGLLTIGEDDVVYFVHQSAKDYLMKSAIFPDGHIKGHQLLVTQSFSTMEQILKRDIYQLNHPGFPIAEVEVPPGNPLGPIRYACVYWVDHLCEAEHDYQGIGGYDTGKINSFLRVHFLHWLEALSLIGSISDGVLAIVKLVELLKRISPESQLERLVADMHRYILSFRDVIESHPLQAYVSALLFSPSGSLTRELFKGEEPGWITTKPVMEAGWGACIQTLYGHRGAVTSVAFSSDDTKIISGSWDGTVRIWDIKSGACVKILDGGGSSVESVAVSADDRHIVSGLRNGGIQAWDAKDGTCIRTLKGHVRRVSVAISPSGTQIVSGSRDKTVKIWDFESGACARTLRGHGESIRAIAISPDGTQIASASEDVTIRFWDAATGSHIRSLTGHTSWVRSVAFSPDNMRLVSGSDDHTVKIWSVKDGSCVHTLKGHVDYIKSAIFSPGGAEIATGSWDGTLIIRNVSSNVCTPVFRGDAGTMIESLAFSHDGQRVSVASGNTIKLWDITSGNCVPPLEGRKNITKQITLSNDGARALSVSNNRNTLKIWDTRRGACAHTLEVPEKIVQVTFAYDSSQIILTSDSAASSDWDTRNITITTLDAGNYAPLNALSLHSSAGYSGFALSYGSTEIALCYEQSITIWDLNSGSFETFCYFEDQINAIVFSYDDTQIAGASDKSIKIWNFNNRSCILTFELKEIFHTPCSLTFSPDGTTIACSSWDKIEIFDLSSGACVGTIAMNQYISHLMVDATNSKLITNKGTLLLNMSPDGMATVEEPQYCGYGIGIGDTWIIRNGQNVLWLPEEYRPRYFFSSDVKADTIVLGSTTGRVIIMRFSSDIYPY
ncbi:WD40-repeat-containing domain protein [Xylogone sp. PMI_703]|nr:WD40-repeat-containing domain protein [Xylogone sp. PMI_703]